MPVDMPQGAVPAPPFANFRTIAFGTGFIAMLAVLLMLGQLGPTIPAV